jgi:hypothetical protein
MDKHFTPQPERFWEKYAIVPFFLAFAALNCGIGYLVVQDTKKEQKSSQIQFIVATVIAIAALVVSIIALFV